MNTTTDNNNNNADNDHETSAATAAPPLPDRLLTPGETAAALNLSGRTLHKLVTSRALEHIRIGKSVRFSLAALERYKAAQTVAAV